MSDFDSNAKPSDAHLSDSEIAARVAATRRRLENTLDAIEDKVNVPKRVKASYGRNPVPWIAGAVGTAGAIIGLIAWRSTRD